MYLILEETADKKKLIIKIKFIDHKQPIFR